MSKSSERIDRRDFILGASATGFAGAMLGGCQSRLVREGGDFDIGADYPLLEPDNILYSTCLQCNTGCGIKVKMHNGVAVKIDGSPYAPHALYPHLPYDSSPFDVADIDGAICPKGQAGLQSVYDPYRIVKVLKRAGKRGENKWVSIDFRQAVKEIVEGGKLFADVSGEEGRVVEGLRSIRSLDDPKVAKHLDSEIKTLMSKVKALRKSKAPESDITAAIEEFKGENADYLQFLIDPNHPDLGPKNNQLVFNWGRLKAGRSELIKRWTVDSFGSTNAHGHTTVCQGSLYFTGKAMSDQWIYDEKSHEVKWTGGDKFYWQADTGNAEFLIFAGASPFEGNYGPPGRCARITTSLSEGHLKYVVIDPRFSKTASKAWKWLPNEPGTEGAIALGMIRWIIDNERYDKKYLSNANKAAATGDGESNWCNATWLIEIDDKGNPGKFVRSQDVGLGGPQVRTDEEGNSYAYDLFVCMVDGAPVSFDPYDETAAVEGDLYVDTVLAGKRVKSGLQLVRESANEHTIDEWAEIAGLRATDIVEVAKEFTSHGKKAAVDIHRGVSQHTNGFYNVLCWYTLNLLIGSYDHKGGLSKASAYNFSGDKAGKPLPVAPFPLSQLHPGKTKAFGLSVIRHDAKYEQSTLFEGFPAKRPWYPLASDVYQEVIPSIGEQYPYPIKALILYMGSPVYALPGGHALIEILRDTEKLPLFIASDIVIGETSMYADYIFPDLTYLERWEFQGSHPSFAPKIQPVRSPVIPPVTDEVSVYGQEIPISLESMLMAFAEELDLPGFGKDGFGPGTDFVRPEDFYLKMVANIALGEKEGEAVPDATDEEMALFSKSRRHLPTSVFDEAKWRAAAGEDTWRKVVYVLNRGGRYQDYDKSYDGEMLKNKYGKLINMYCEKVADTKNSRTGEKFAGLARHYEPYADSLGNPIDDVSAGFDMKLTTYREISHTKSRTASNYWLLALLPENFVLMNRADAQRKNLREGDEVLIASASNPDGVWPLGNGVRKPMTGKLRVVEGMRPGTISFALGFGHWAYGSSDVVIDGKTIRKDDRRGRGIHANAAMRLDPTLKNTSLSDPVGASVSFYDTTVSVRKV